MLRGVAGVNDRSDLHMTDTGADVLVDYGTGSFLVQNVAGTSLLDRAADRARVEGVAIEHRILERAAPASQAIVRQARLGKFDLIVMGTHGRKGVARLVLGSTAEHVLRDAPCAVLVVHLPRE